MFWIKFPFLSKIENSTITNPHILLLLGVFNVAIVMNFIDLWTKNLIAFAGLVLMLMITFLNPKLWWATIINSIIALCISLKNWPRLANHSNIEVVLELLFLLFLGYKIFNKKTKISQSELANVFRVSLVLIYFFAGFHKLNNDFFNPCVSCVNTINNYAIKNLTFNQISFSNNGFLYLQYATIFVEMILPFGLFFKKYRKAVAAILLLFHVYLSFTVFADFSALAGFLILGCLLDDENFINNKKTENAFRVYTFFVLIAVFLKPFLLHYNNQLEQLPFIIGCVFNIGWLVFFGVVWKNYNPQKSFFTKNQIPLLLIITIGISFWTLKTYIGLGNAGNLTMFSNLLTEKTRSNHFFIDTKNTKLFDFEEDNIMILKLHDTLNRVGLKGFKIPKIEFEVLVNEWSEKYQLCPLNAVLVYQNDTIVIPDLKNSRFNQSKWWWKFVVFRKIQPEGANNCYW